MGRVLGTFDEEARLIERGARARGVTSRRGDGRAEAQRGGGVRRVRLLRAQRPSEGERLRDRILRVVEPAERNGGSGERAQRGCLAGEVPEARLVAQKLMRQPLRRLGLAAIERGLGADRERARERREVAGRAGELPAALESATCLLVEAELPREAHDRDLGEQRECMITCGARLARG